MIDVEVHAEVDVPANQVDEVRRRIASLEQYTDEPIISARVTLRRGPERSKNRYVADASVLFAPHKKRRVECWPHTSPRPPRRGDRRGGRPAAAPAPARRGRRGRERNEPSEIRKALESLPLERVHRPEADLKPPEERQIVRRRTYADHPEATLEAAGDMFDLDEEFHLFVHVRTNEDVVVHRRDDRRVGLIHPRGSILADETDEVVSAEANRYSEPLTLDAARAEMDIVNHSFLYYDDAGRWPGPRALPAA